MADPDKEGEDLPDMIGLSQEEIDRYYILWAWWKATGKRFLPSQMMYEPNEPMAVILEIDSYYEKILEQLTKDTKSDGEDI